MYSQDPTTNSKVLFNFFMQSEQILFVYLLLQVFVKAIWLFENKFVIRCQIRWTAIKNSNIFWIFQVPEETCNLTPKKQCKHVTRLVPNLKPVEDCIDVSCYKKMIIRIRCQIRWRALKIPIFLNFRCRRKFAQNNNYHQGRLRNQSTKSGATPRNQKFTEPH